MPLSQITIVVTINTSDFTASSQEESHTDAHFDAAVAGLLPKMAALHAQLQGIPDNDLSQEGKDFRDAPLQF